MELNLIGAEGTIRAEYHTAMSFGAWRIQTIGPTLFRADCHVLHANPAWLAYRPLVGRFRLPSGAWWSFALESEIVIDVEDGDRIATFYIAGDPVPVQGG